MCLIYIQPDKEMETKRKSEPYEQPRGSKRGRQSLDVEEDLRRQISNIKTERDRLDEQNKRFKEENSTLKAEITEIQSTCRQLEENDIAVRADNKRSVIRFSRLL